MPVPLETTMKRKANISKESRFHCVCPFCGYLVGWQTELSWCSKCFVEFTVTDRGIVFDDAKHTPRFAFAKAVMKSGGFGVVSNKSIDATDPAAEATETNDAGK